MHTICSTKYRLPTIVHTLIVPPLQSRGFDCGLGGTAGERWASLPRRFGQTQRGVGRHNLASKWRLTRQRAAVAGGAVDGPYSKVMGGLGRARDEEQPPSEDSIHPGMVGSLRREKADGKRLGGWRGAGLPRSQVADAEGRSVKTGAAEWVAAGSKVERNGADSDFSIICAVFSLPLGRVRLEWEVLFFMGRAYPNWPQKGFSYG